MPSGRRASSDRSGVFVFRDVLPGDARITVSYPGLDEEHKLVKVSSDATTEVRFMLREDVPIELQPFVVQGAKQGMARATAMQKASDNLKMIAAADQFGDITGNMGEYLKYLPGVGPDGFDARNVSLRGMAPFLTSITSDGTSVASASSGDLSRISELETLSLGNVEAIEVTKTLTPDQSATNTAGSINMISKSAFDQENATTKYRFFLNVPGEPAFHSLRSVGADSGEKMALIRPNAELNLTRRLGEHWGVYTGVGFYQFTQPAQVRAQWEYEFNPANGGLPNDPAPNFWRLHNERDLKTNRDASLRIDWRPTEKTKWNVAASWNSYEVKFHYDNLEFNWNTRPALAFGQAPQFTMSTRNARSSVSASTGNEAGFIDMVVVDRDKYATTSTTSTTLEHTFQDGDRLKAVASVSRSTNRYRDSPLGRFGEGYSRISNVRIETHDVGVPVPNFILAHNNVPLDLSDLTNYRVMYGHTMPSTADENRYGGMVNYTKEAIFRVPVAVRVGAQWDETDRVLDRQFYETTNNPMIPAGTGMLAVKDDVASSAPGALGFPAQPAFIDLKKLWVLYANSPARPYTSNYLAKFDEENTAGFVRADVRPLRDWLLIAGVRHEEIRSKGLNKLVGVRGSFRNNGDFGSLNLKFTPSANHVWRTAATQSMGLPDYSDLLPGTMTIVDPSSTGNRGKVTLSNPSLRPYKVTNYDLAYEFHFRETGVFSAAVFRKVFTNYIVAGTQALDDSLAAAVQLKPSQLSGKISDYDLVTRFNIPDRGYYNGIELSYAEQFTRLPAPFNTLGLQASFTRIQVEPIKTSRVLVSGNTAQNAALVDQVAHALELNAMPVQASLVMNWRYRKLSTQAALSFQGQTLRSLSQQTIQYTGRPVEYINVMRRNESRTVVDLKMEYRWRRQCVPYVQIRNLFNSAGRLTANGYYVYDNHRSWPTYEFGVRGLF